MNPDDIEVPDPTVPGNGAEYTNPVIGRSLPDPTVVRADDGRFYLYATEDVRNVPIYRSTNLVDWDYVGTHLRNLPDPPSKKEPASGHRISTGSGIGMCCTIQCPCGEGNGRAASDVP